MSSDSLTDQYSDDYSDQDSDAYEWKGFAVVRATVNDKDKYDCIPTKWILPDEDGDYGYQTTVTYKFPSRAELGKGKRFRKNQACKKNWPEFTGKMLLDTDSKAAAFKLIKQEKEKTKKCKKEDGFSSNSSDSGSGEENEANKKLESETNELAKQLHSHCQNFYDEFKASHEKSISVLDNTVEYLQKMISSHKEIAATKEKLLSSLPPSQRPSGSSPNDTKWTLRYPNPGPGLTELVLGTGVYVSEKGLSEAKIKFTSSTEFTRGLLEEVFTGEAIRTCSYTGQPPRSMPGKESYSAKPGLDLNARQTLVDYSLKYSGERGWLYGDTPKENTDRIINSIKGKLYEANKKSM